MTAIFALLMLLLFPNTDTFSVEGPNGDMHSPCRVIEGEPSSTLICLDGFTEQS